MADETQEGPWTKFQATSGAAGPWTKYAAPALAKPAAPEQSVAERLWGTAKEMLSTGPQFAKGVAEGVMGAGVPAGKGSEFEGGRAGFAGRALGTGGRSIAESLWNDVVKAPGKMATGEMQPGPEAEAAARGTAMMMAGGGFRPGAMAGQGTMLRPPPAAAPGVAPVGGATRLATVQMPSGPPRTVQSPPLTPEQMPLAGPLAATGVGAGPPPSALGMAIASDNPVAVDQAITRGYRRAVQPGVTGVKMNATGLAQEDQRIMSVVDRIIDNRQDLKLTNMDGSSVAEGAMPRTRRQFLEAQDQTKKAMFREFDDMNRQAGSMGIQVDPSPAITHLREVAENPAVLDLHPSVSADARRLADNMERRGAYTPEAMQDLIQDLNSTLSSFYKNPTRQSASEGRVLAPLADILRKSLDDAIEGAVGPGYQAFRTQYGAMRSVERDLTNAARKELSQRPGFVSQYADLLASDSFIRGVFTLSPETIAKAGFLQAAKQVVKYTNDPNRAIERLFQRRLSSRSPPSPPGRLMPMAAGAGAVATGDQMARRPGDLSGMAGLRKPDSEFDVTPPPGPR